MELYRSLNNSNSILLWGEGEKYFTDSPPYVFIEIDDKWSLYSPSINRLGVSSFSTSAVPKNLCMKYNRLVNSVPESFS